jgi:lipoprotein LprG
MMRRCLLLVILTSSLLFGCRAETPAPLPPEEILSHSIDRMYETSGFHFVIERSGAPAFLDLGKTLSLRRMEGDFAAPDRIHATVRIITTGLVAEIEVISIGAIQWETNPLSGRWEQLPPDWGFNPTALFDPSTGIQPILENDLEDLQYMGNQELEEWPGELLYSLTGLLKGSRIFRTTYGLIGPGMLDLQLWISPETFELYRMVIVDEMDGEEEPSTWTIDFWDYDHVIEIEAPLSEATPAQ